MARTAAKTSRSTAPTRGATASSPAELRELLRTLTQRRAYSCVISDALQHGEAGVLMLRLRHDRCMAPAGPPRAYWYFRHTGADGVRRQKCLGRCDPAGKRGLDRVGAELKARELWQQLKSSAAGNLADLRRQQRAKQLESLERDRLLTAQRDMTLARLVDTYLSGLEAAGKLKSARDARRLIRIHVEQAAPDLWTTPAAQVKPEAFTDLIRTVVGANKHRTAGKVRSYLHAAYESALRVDVDPAVERRFRDFGIVSNPVRATRLSGAGVRARQRVLSDTELGDLLQQLRRRRSHAAEALRVLIDLGGQRQEQLWRVTPDDVSTERRTLRLLDPKGRRTQARVHLLPLLGRTRVQVARLLARARSLKAPWLFSSQGAVALRDETVRELFRDIMQKARARAARAAQREGAGEERSAAGSDVRLSDVRRTVETYLAQAGFARDERGWLLSHGQAGVQGRFYENVDALPSLRKMLRHWQAHLLRLERAARLRARALDRAEQAVVVPFPQAAGAPTRRPRRKPAAARPPERSTDSSAVAAEMPTPIQLYTMNDVCKALRISRSTLVRERQKDFPPPTLEIAGSPRWSLDALMAWLATRQSGSAATPATGSGLRLVQPRSAQGG